MLEYPATRVLTTTLIRVTRILGKMIHLLGRHTPSSFIQEFKGYIDMSKQHNQPSFPDPYQASDMSLISAAVST